MRIRMAIADENKEYVERILSVMEGFEGITLFAYTNRDALERALSSKQFDILLYDPSVYGECLKMDSSMLTIMLLDESVRIPETCRDYKKIRKYQRISRIYKQVLELYAEVCGDAGVVAGQGGVISIAFYSPVGGVGKTTVALAAATRLAMQGYRTFYLNLENIASEDCYLLQNSGKGLSEIASCLGENINFPMKIQSLLQSKVDNLYYLNHFDSPNDIGEMTADEIDKLIEQLKKTGLFDALVIDMGVDLNDKAQSIFGAADRIVLLEKPDAMAVCKYNCFLKQIHIMNEYGNKMARVLNFDLGRGSAIQSEIPLVGRIPMIQNPDAAQLIVSLANGVASGFVMQLVR